MNTSAYKSMLLLASFTISFSAVAGCDSRIPFDSKTWTSASKGEDCLRSNMTDALVAKLAKGTVQSDVHSLLGKPDTDSNSRKAGWLGITAPFDAYEIRFYRGMIDYQTDYFVVEYDSENKLLRSCIVTEQG